MKFNRSLAAVSVAGLVVCFQFIAVACLAQSIDSQTYDIVITHGHIIDGTGSPWYSGDVGIRSGRIAAIGDLARAARTRSIDAHGEIVAPGFIDMLGQSGRTILVDPRLPSKIYQGITTEITGEGDSAAPLNDAMIQEDRSNPGKLKIVPDWLTFRQYFARLEKQGIGINFASYVGATQVRRIVLGDSDIQPTPAQLGQMQALVRQAMLDGTVGVSTALQYSPAPYSRTPELVALAAVASQYGGIYATHMRSESDTIFPAIDEALQVGSEAHIPVEIWHLKAAGKSNWGRMPQIVARIDAARARGTDVSADTYAYTAWSNDLSAFIPPWAHDGGDLKMLARLQDPTTREKIRKDMLLPTGNWDNPWQEIPGPGSVLICSIENPKLQPLQGQTLEQIAKLWGKDPIDTVFDLLVQDKAGTGVAVFGMSQSDVTLALQQPWVSIDTDSEGISPVGVLGQSHPHPRAYGTFPRILRKYVREERKLSMEEAIRKFTALPAQRMRFADRGVLKQGMWADIVIFNPDTIRDVATYENPNRFSQGMDYVLVNGIPVIDRGKMTSALPGKVLRGEGYVANTGQKK